MGHSEPAVDLIATRSLLTADARESFRGAADVARGRGWALSSAPSRGSRVT